MNRLVVATHNSHKTREIRDVLSGLFADFLDLSAFHGICPAVEDGATFEDNARIKALHASRHLPAETILADDSGLEADALDGAPGVYSARYAGQNATDETNRRKLLAELGDSPNRRARFRCVLVLARAGEIEAIASGAAEGRIANRERGDGGFGYDSVFEPDGFSETFAELAPAVKNSISHRARALRELAGQLRLAL